MAQPRSSPMLSKAHQRALVVGQRFGQGALDVGQDAQVLLGASPELGAGSAQLQRPVELLPGLLDGAALEVKPGQRIEGLGGQHRVAHDRCAVS